jgi:predicted phosphohydrolase
MNGHALLAFTADLHWGHPGRGDEAARGLAAFLRDNPPDVLVIAGDLGTANYFSECLQLFQDLPCQKALVPGNHDVWVRGEESRPDSLQLYEDLLPQTAAQYSFHYLDNGPLYLPEADLALVGSMNWYDYSWAAAAIRRDYPEHLDRLQSKRFTRGRHNDANFVRWPLDDATFTARVVAAMERQLDEALASAGRVIVVTHHPPFYGLSFPRPGQPETLESVLWDAFCGNQAMEDALARRGDRIAFAFCGHTHRARENALGPIRGYNVGGDYHFKRLLWLDWPAGTIKAHQFGDPAE